MGRRVLGRDDVSQKKKVRRRLAIWIPVGVVVLLLGLSSAWVVTRAFQARDLLTSSIPLASDIQKDIVGGHSDQAQITALLMAKRSKSAVELTSDPIWRAFEIVPVVGPNLTAVRTSASVFDGLVRKAVLPLAGVSIDEIKPVNGAINLKALAAANTLITKAEGAIEESRHAMSGVHTSGLLPQVSGGVAKLNSALDKAAGLLTEVKPVLKVLPGMLGADGPRHYLLLFQNNAESRALGGNPASLVLITADQGKIQLGQQASSGDFAKGNRPPVAPVDAQTQALYGNFLTTYEQNITQTPDFPTTAYLANAFWKERFGTPIDAVVSFDPIGLQRLLKVTGPVTLSTGDKLTQTNAVELLLHEAYLRYPTQKKQDAFFGAAAAQVFKLVTSGKGSTTSLVNALKDSINNGDLMAWSSRKDEQAIIAGTRISGTLPKDNKDQTVLGVYINDRTGAKMDYYLATTADVTDQCPARGARSYTVTVDLTNTLDPAQAAALPYFVRGSFFTAGHIVTELVVYGPPGSISTSSTVDGAKVTPDFAGPHLGRTAVKITIENAPAAKHVAVLTFSAPAAKSDGRLKIFSTPMIQPMKHTTHNAVCE